MIRGSSAWFAIGVAMGLIFCGMASAWAQPTTGMSATSAGTQKDMNLFEVVMDSLAGDVYAPGRWKPLPFATFFSEGWDEPWAGGPNGQDGEGAPRQGWLNAQDGVFYRLAIATFGYQHNVGNGDNWTSAISVCGSF